MNLSSVSGKNWQFKKFNPADIIYYSENFSLSEIIAKLISIRKKNIDDINLFLNPKIKNLMPNPFQLMDMEAAIERTIKSINNKDLIGIFGDYDVDGASSTALLAKYFQLIKQKIEIYIPDRQKEGYGPNNNAFKNLIEKGSKIIFTVDCGTLSFEPIKFAKSLNTDVIVLDHHQSDINLPNACAVINPNRIDDKSGLNYLSAAGVCFIFLVGLNKKLRDLKWFSINKIDEPDILNFLDLVSLGTVCDVVPLIGLNRAIVKQGLKIIKKRSNLGIKTLYDLCKIQSQPTTFDLGYKLGPRINAGGRVGKSSYGAELLISNDPKKAFEIALNLDKSNKERQSIELMLSESVNDEVKKYHNHPLLVVSGKNWHEGVIGIVASKIKDKYKKPTILISVENDIGKASARSIIGFDIGTNIIAAAQEKILLKGGGHKMAGGFSIKVENIEKFKKFINRKFEKINEDLKKEKPLYLDSVISSSSVNLDFYQKVNNLAPFGSGNPEPKFLIENLKSVNNKIIKDKHIKSVLIGQDGSKIKAVAFNSVENEIGAYLLKKDSNLFNIAGKLSLNEWKGQSNVEFIIDDISVNKTFKNTVPSSIG